jgi:hypothetical protein
VVSVTDPYSRILGFLDRSRYFSQLLSCTHKAEWTPFQTHYFFFLVVRAILAVLVKFKMLRDVFKVSRK